MNNFARAFAPATVANVGCAYDVMGFALTEPGDIVEARLCPSAEGNSRVEIAAITGDGAALPRAAALNSAGAAAAALWRAAGALGGLSLTLHKKLPLSSGLGSSAASAVAAVVAANALLTQPLAKEQLLPFALEGERAACGSAHADNAAPALLGGFVLIRSYQPLDAVKLPSPPDLCCAICHPHIAIKTTDARRVLKREVPLEKAVAQWGNVGGLVAGLLLSDYELIRRSLPDHIIESARALLIPGFESVRQAALAQGALGCSISGSGPALFALARSPEQAAAIGAAMQAAFTELTISSDCYQSAINTGGACLLELS